MGYYPAMIDLTDRLCLVVGGGEVGRRKIEALIRAGARVRVVDAAPDEALTALAARPGIEVVDHEFQPEHLEGVVLVVAATDDARINQAVSRAAMARGVPINVVDVPELCTFIVPAALRRGDLTIAVSTAGASPALAARIRRELEERFGPEWGVALSILRRVRQKILARGQGAAENKVLFQRLADSALVELVAARDTAAVDRVLTDVLGPGFKLADLGLDLEPEEEA